MTPAEREKYRRCVAWRLTREIAYREGLIGREDPLSALSSNGPGPWLIPSAARPCLDPQLDVRKPYTEWTLDALILHAGGLALMPAPDNVYRFAATIRRLGRELRMIEGSPRVPGMWHFAFGDCQTDEDLLRVWPAPAAIEVFEESVIRHAHHLAVTRAKHSAAEDLHQLLGVSRNEAIALLRMSIALHARAAFEDLEDKRYLMERRIEDYLERSRHALDLDAEAKALKMLAAIQGLTRTDPTTTMDEILKTIAAVARDAEAPALPAPPDHDRPRITATEVRDGET